MKNYKFLLIVFIFTVLGIFATVTYIDMPAPDKLKNKTIDVNNQLIIIYSIAGFRMETKWAIVKEWEIVVHVVIVTCSVWQLRCQYRRDAVQNLW